MGMMKAGDLVIFVDEPGLVVEHMTEPGDDPAVLVQFFGERCAREALHYYEHELQQWASEGTIKIQHAT